MTDTHLRSFARLVPDQQYSTFLDPPKFSHVQKAKYASNLRKALRTERLLRRLEKFATCVCSSVFLFNLELLRTSQFERNNFTVGSIEQLYFVAGIKLWVCPSLNLIFPFTSKLLTATISGVFTP